MSRAAVKAKKVLVAMSGGVDSSVTAALLQRQGYLVEGAYMQCWSSGPYCSTEIDRADSLRVATQLGIAFHVFDFESQYKAAVLDYFFSEYQGGRTPNPDVACNREIKFGIFLKKALEMGFGYIATGHYARVEWDQSSEKFKLLAALDPTKDQSYFLYTLGQEQLKHSLFPIGIYTKREVREIAASLGLPVANKKDSQGICFIGPVNVKDFLRQNLKTKVGKIVSSEGQLLGEHEGLAFYTIGQREGLKVNSSLPHYVVGKKRLTNELIAAPIGSGELFSREARLSDPSWVSSEQPKMPFRVAVSLRYHQKPAKATLGYQKGKLTISFDEPQRGVTDGQAAVFYQKDEVLGGATIET